VNAPSGEAVRPVDPAVDLPSVSALILACDLVDVGEPDLPEDWTREMWRNPSAWAFVAEAEDAVVGYLEIEAIDTATSFDAYVAVHPDRREGPLALSLVGLAEDEVTARATGPDVALRVTGAATDVAFAEAIVGAGYTRVRTFWHMERPLAADEPAGDPPPGVRIRPSIDPEDDEVVHDVLDEAFRGHFGIEPMSLEEWRIQFKDGMYDPGLVLIAEAEGEVVGVAANWMPDGLGWVGDLGVRASHRGRGIGAALLRHSFALLAARGATQVRLNVDAENESGATRLYASVGMTERRRFHVYEKRVGAAG
jgi:mycothiol synthase